MKTSFFLLTCILAYSFTLAQKDFESDVIQTSAGDLRMYFINHGTLMFEFNKLTLHVDPVGRAADYSNMPQADIVLVTHHHGDHLDKETIGQISKTGTKIVLTQACYDQVQIGEILKNGASISIKGIKIEAVPAYNLTHKRGNGEPYHPKGIGNGYVINFGDKRVYIGGDTENFPEMRQLKNIEVAFLPMNLPFTMTPEMVADAVSMFYPKILYPYHYGQSDTEKLADLLKNQSDTELRIRDFY